MDTIKENQTAEFLRALLGGERANAFIGVKRPDLPEKKNFRNIAVSNVAESIAAAREQDAAGRDVYTSCAQFETHDNRQADNAKQANSMWLDLDCGDDKAAAGRGYKTKSDAAKALAEFVKITGLPQPTVVDSGNGLHVYFMANAPIPADVWKAQAEKLKALTHHYGLLADDTRTTDIASVLRVPGTHNRKAPENPKPVKLKRLIAPSDANELIGLIDAAYIAAVRNKAAAVQVAHSPVVADSEAADLAMVEKLSALMAEKHPHLWAGNWHGEEFDGREVHKGYPSQSEADYATCGHILREALRAGVKDGALADTVMAVFECSGLYRDKKRQQVETYAIPRLIAEALAKRDAHAQQAEQVTQTETGAELADHEPGDILAGKQFARAMRGKLAHVSVAGKWLRWEGTRWVWCACGEEMQAAKWVAGRILEHAAKLFAADPNKHGKLLNFAKKLQNLARLQAMIELAKSEDGMSIGHMAELDSDPMLLGVRNGVVNLRDGGLLAADPKMLITRQVAAEFHSDAECPSWLAFLSQVFDGDQETIDYLQRALGYTLTGKTGEEKLFICFGHGANGKSVFANVVSTIMADYSQAAPASLLTVRRPDDTGARNDLAMLCGARLVSINETANGDRLDEQVVKQLAGREQISARFLHKEFFQFWPTAKPWLRTNHKPIITGEDDGIWRRLDLIGYRRKFAEHERDPNLEEKLLEEREGILAWMIRGCLEWQRHGLKPSATVRRESATYRKESDLLGEFLDDRTECTTDARIERGEFFTKWRCWCDENGYRAGTQASISRKMTERSYEQVNSNGKRYYAGVAWRSS